MVRLFPIFSLFALFPVLLRAADSLYPSFLQDPAAVSFDRETFPSLRPGGDATALLQEAIDRVARRAKFGIVLVPSGDYALSDTVHIWVGVRVIGHGPTRPRFHLRPRTEGFGEEAEPRHLFHFADDYPEPGEPIRNANPGTFYSALSNVVIALGEGNPGAIGVRAHFAQHCFIGHVRFEIGDGFAGLQKVGNLFHHCEFIGGQYGIVTTKPSPSWPFVLLDSRFEGQSKAAILTAEAGFTIVRSEFVDMPTAIEMRPNRSEELVVEDSVFRGVENLVTISNGENPRTQVNLINLQCEGTAAVATFRETGKQVPAPRNRFRLEHFSHGLHLDGWGHEGVLESRLDWTDLPAGPLETPADPARSVPSNTQWVDVTVLGAIGDGLFDNTEILQRAIDAGEPLYFPTGRYRVTETLRLRPDSCLLGLSPITTQILIHDREPAFHPGGVPKAVIESARGGAAIFSGLGIDPGAINYRAAALKWRAGEHSLVEDVRFLGGHGTFDVEGNYLPIYNNNRSGDSDPARRWDTMPASLWVTEGGGGTFRNLWTPSPFAHAGMLIEETTTPGWVYQISSEHHLRNELIVRDVQNWKFYAIQFEEESWEGRRTLPLQIEESAHLRFHNTYLYRVSRTFTPFPSGIHVRDVDEVEFFGIHAYGPTKFTFDNTVSEANTRRHIRTREIARLSIPGDPLPEPPTPPFKLVAEGFNHIDSPEVDSRGRLYFVDGYAQAIHRWDGDAGTLELISDRPIEPEQIILEDDAHLLVISRLGKVYRISCDGAYGEIEELAPIEGAAPAGMRYVMPVTRWRDGHDFLDQVREPTPFHFRSGDLCLPVSERFVRAGPRSTYFSTIDMIRAFDLRIVEPGEEVLSSDEFDQKTWQFVVGEEGTLTQPELFAEQGEAGVLEMPDGSVVILEGDLFVYDAEGTRQGRIPVPDRPTGVALGGSEGDLLYVLARTRLYQIRWPMEPE